MHRTRPVTIMKRRYSLLIASLLLSSATAACDATPAKTDATQAKAAADAKHKDGDRDANHKDGDTKPAADTPADPAVDARVAASGLDVGMRFKAFDIINCDTGDEYCQVCKYGPSPKIMAIGTIDDPAFRKDLQDLDAIVAKFGSDKVKAFAVIAIDKDGVLVTPTGDKDALIAQAKALRTELDIDMPVVIPAPKDSGPNGVFEDHYQVSKSRTIMFADGQNKVQYSEIAPEDYAALDAAIKATVG